MSLFYRCGMTSSRTCSGLTLLLHLISQRNGLSASLVLCAGHVRQAQDHQPSFATDFQMLKVFLSQLQLQEDVALLRKLQMHNGALRTRRRTTGGPPSLAVWS